jgi:type II secretory pathway pseudopilin PulG
LSALPPAARHRAGHSQRGLSYIEIMITVGITAIIMASLMGVMDTATDASEEVRQRNSLTRDARFAMHRMVSAVSHSRHLLLPLHDNPNTNWPEHIREQTVPASPPIGDSTLATAVLAVSLAEDIDLDGDGKPDADNDGDGRFDEDPSGDITADNAPGLVGIDDDGDGNFDESFRADDDEYFGFFNEDPRNGFDDDGDGTIDEDFGADANGDGCPGLCGVDDDGDGSIDEGHVTDDDEDGDRDEDFIDTRVFYLSGNVLRERTTVPWNVHGGGQIDGEDYIESDIASGVTRFRVERVADITALDLVDITLELTDPLGGETISLRSRVRVGGGL